MSTIDRLHGYLGEERMEGSEDGDAAGAASPDAASPAADADSPKAAPASDLAAGEAPGSPAPDVTDAFLDHFKIRMGPQKMPNRAHREFLKAYGKGLAEHRAVERSVRYPIGMQEYPQTIRIQYKGDGSLPDEQCPVQVASLFVRVHTPYTDLRFSIKHLPPGVELDKNDEYVFEVLQPTDLTDKVNSKPLLVIRDIPRLRPAGPHQPVKPRVLVPTGGPLGGPSGGFKRGAAQVAAASITSQLRGDHGTPAKKTKLMSTVLAAGVVSPSLKTRPDLPVPDAVKGSPNNGTNHARELKQLATGGPAHTAAARQPLPEQPIQDPSVPWQQVPSEDNLPEVYVGLLRALEALGAGSETKWRYWRWALEGQDVAPWCERRFYCWQDISTDPDALRVTREVFDKKDAALEASAPGAAAAAIEMAAAASLPAAPSLPKASGEPADSHSSEHQAALSKYATRAVVALAGAGVLSAAQRNDIFNALDLNDIGAEHMGRYLAEVLHPGWQAGDVVAMLWGLLCVVSPAAGGSG